MEATLEQIVNILPHPNADRLDLGMIRGYQVVVGKEQFYEGETVLYIHPDSCLPKNQNWAEPYLRYVTKRVKAVKLRGEWSEGLCIKLTDLEKTILETLTLSMGEELGELLGVTHYEAPAPQDENAKGGLPWDIPKTDQKRVEELRKPPYGEIADVTLKIDGKSCSLAYNYDLGELVVIGRKLSYDVGVENDYGRAFPPDLVERFVSFCKERQVSLAIRGECYGKGIQGHEINPHAKLNKGFALFDVYNIKTREYERKGSELYYENVGDILGIECVPFIERDIEITPELVNKYSKELTKLNGQPFEGVVVKYATGSFKILNKDYDANK